MPLASVWCTWLIIAPISCLAVQFSCSAISDTEACLPTWFVSSLPSCALFPLDICLCDAFSAYTCHPRIIPLKHSQVRMCKSNLNSSLTPYGFSESRRGWNHSNYLRCLFIHLPIFFGQRWIVQLCCNPKSGDLCRKQEHCTHLPDAG